MRRRPSFKLTLALLVLCSLAVAAYAANRGPRTQGDAQFLGHFIWTEPEPWFGGFSGIEISANGQDMILLSDRGRIARARITRSAGQITGIAVQEQNLLKAPNGQVLPEHADDSEGLAVGADGAIYISFEGTPRVARYRTLDGPATDFPSHRVFKKLALNLAFEALAIDANGWLYTLPEKARDPAGNLPLWRYVDGSWSKIFGIEETEGFAPVGADIGPDGRFYLLERKFNLVGFRSRLRRWDMQGSDLSNEVLLMQSRTGTYDNLEGLSVWRDSKGTLTATMISDDNFRALQKTEVIEYALPD